MLSSIAGVAPTEEQEVTVMSVWPSNALYPSGRMLGQLYSIELGVWPLTLGNFLVLASIPHALLLFFWRLLPVVGTRYRLTNRRVIEERGLMHEAFKSIELDRFDSIEIEVAPGQAWYSAGNLIFKQGAAETFRLEGVSRPEAFRSQCIKSHMAFVGVKKALKHAAA
jgi:hypothetical protein